MNLKETHKERERAIFERYLAVLVCLTFRLLEDLYPGWTAPPADEISLDGFETKSKIVNYFGVKKVSERHSNLYTTV